MSIEVTDTVIKVGGTQVLKAQEAAEADAAAATAAAAALTGAANAGVTGAANAGVTGAVVGDTQATQNTGWGAASEAEFDSMHVAIDANVVDIALILAQADKSTVDIALILAQADKSTVDVAAQKVELDKLITDHAAVLATLNAFMAKMRTHGLIAT